jgi:uncharacterized membrane protein YqaE (UPF0057 family)
MCCSSDIFLGFLAILFPPLPVWVKSGLCSADSLINILLCLLGFIPGLLHAWYIIAKHPEPDYTYSRIPENPEAGHRVTYIVVSPQPTPAPSSAPKPYNHHAQTQHHQHHQQQHHGYGTVSNPQGSSSSAAAASSSNNTNNASHHADDNDAAPPPYQEAVGDHKVQTR